MVYAVRIPGSAAKVCDPVYDCGGCDLDFGPGVWGCFSVSVKADGDGSQCQNNKHPEISIAVSHTSILSKTSRMPGIRDEPSETERSEVVIGRRIRSLKLEDKKPLFFTY